MGTDYVAIAQAAGQMGMGTFQNVKGSIKSMRAKRLLDAIPREEPETRLRISDLRRKERAYETGAGVAPRRRAISKGTAGITSGIIQQGAGGGATLSSLAAASEGVGSAYNEALMEGQAASIEYGDRVTALLQHNKQRALELELVKYSQLMAEGQSMKKAGMGNIYAAALGGPGAGQQGVGAGDDSPTGGSGGSSGGGAGGGMDFSEFMNMGQGSGGAGGGTGGATGAGSASRPIGGAGSGAGGAAGAGGGM